MPIELPVIESCDGCGACCMHVGSPLGFAVFFAEGGDTVVPWAIGNEDHPIVLSMPAELRNELREYYAGVYNGTVRDRGAHDDPCLWLDMETRKCKHYEYRPSVCRGFEMGSKDCRRLRIARGIQTPMFALPPMPRITPAKNQLTLQFP